MTIVEARDLWSKHVPYQPSDFFCGPVKRELICQRDVEGIANTYVTSFRYKYPDCEVNLLDLRDAIRIVLFSFAQGDAAPIKMFGATEAK
jgi:hypothetical protein